LLYKTGQQKVEYKQENGTNQIENGWMTMKGYVVKKYQTVKTTPMF